MTIFTEMDVLLGILPEKWKVIQARSSGETKLCTVILSPDGKKFNSLEDVNDFLLEAKESVRVVSNFEIGSIGGVCSLSESAKLRRKHMTNKSPFRNLLKKTLERNHAIKVSKKKKGYDYQMYLLKRKKEFIRKSKGS